MVNVCLMLVGNHALYEVYGPKIEYLNMVSANILMGYWW